MTPLEAALSYAARGWPVLPLHTPSPDGVCSCRKGRDCDSPGKHPRIRRGVKEASTDHSTITAWWSQWPDANVGIRTGGRIVVLDVDCHDADGEASLALLEIEHDELPLTLEARTGSGGRHLVFVCPPDAGSPTNILPGVDVRGPGTYIVAPPSLHACGGRYEWVNELPVADLGDHPIVPMLRNRARAPRAPKPPPVTRSTATAAPSPNRNVARARGILRSVCSRISTLHDGRRAALLAGAHQLGGYIHLGLPRKEVEEALLDAARACGADRKHDVWRHISYGLDTGEQTPLELPPDDESPEHDSWEPHNRPPEPPPFDHDPDPEEGQPGDEADVRARLAEDAISRVRAAIEAWHTAHEAFDDEGIETADGALEAAFGDPDTLRGLAAAFAVDVAEVEALLSRLATVEGWKSRVVEIGRSVRAAAKQQARRDRESTSSSVRPTLDEPLFVKPPGFGVVYLRTRDGDWIETDKDMLIPEIERHHPDVECYVASDNGAVRRLDFTSLFDRYGQRLERLTYSVTATQSRWISGPHHGGELLRTCAKPDHRVEPRQDLEVDEWLEVLCGERLPKVLDWLATAFQLDKPTTALYLQGPPGCGKGMLYAALARYYGTNATSYRDIFGTPWTSALKNSPIVHLDEKAPDIKNGTALFREFIGNRQHPLTEKNRPTGTLLGCPRVVITANNADALRVGSEKGLTQDDEEAIAMRVLHVRCRLEAKDYLRELGGSKYTHDWIETEDGRPGRLVNHIAWLAKTRRVRPGPRFLVEGDTSGWWQNLVERGGLSTSILLAIATYCSRTEELDLHARPVLYDPYNQRALVRAGELRREWRQLTDNDKTPSPQYLGLALTTLAGGPPVRTRDIPGMEKRPRVYHVPGRLVLEAAIAHGVGDEDRIASKLGLPAPVR